MSADYRERCLYKNLEIDPQRSFSNVLEVHSDHIVESRAASAVNLPQAGDSRLSFKNPASMPELVALKLVGNRRPRPNQRHFSSENVDKLRQLVQAARS